MPRRGPFFPHKGILVDEASRLLADVYAMAELQKVDFQMDGHDPFSDFWDVMNERIDRAVLTTSALARSNDEQTGGLANHVRDFPAGVGILVAGIRTTTLTAREACNKIIHATSGHWNYPSTNQHPILQTQLDERGVECTTIYLAPSIECRGQKNGVRWKATIDFVKWIHAVTKYAG